MPVSRETARRALADGESFGTVLFLAVAAAYGTEPLDADWEPASLYAQLRDDFRVELGGAAFARLMAATAVVVSDRFFVNLPDFLDLANALNGAGFDPTVFDPVSIDEAAWAFTEALLLRSFLDAPVPAASVDVRAYLAAQLEEEGMLRAPDVLAAIVPADLDRVGRVLGDYADDPELHEALYAAENGKTEAVSAGVREKLALLVEQLAGLLAETSDAVVGRLRAS